jgi:hypothetical protein
VNTLNRIVSRNRIHPFFIAAILGVLATGCATYQQQNKAISFWQRGDLTNAVVEATKKADTKTNSVDAVIWRLEQASVLRANGQYEDSNKAFDQAQGKIDDYAQKAKVSITRETGAMLSNQARLPYRGRSYDGIMLNTYKALNYIALGEPDNARPELIRAYERQQDAVEDNKKRIEKSKADLSNQEQANRELVGKIQANSTFQSKIDSASSELDNLKPYADYVNPFTVYLDGLFFMANAADASDLERAHKSFERISTFLSDDAYIKQDLTAVDDLMNGKPLTPTIYVIFETGCAPVRDQIRIDIPTFWPQLPYLGAAFPRMQLQPNYLPGLTVTANSPIVTANEIIVAVTNTVTATNDIVATVTNTVTVTNDTVVTTTNAVATTNDIVGTVTNTVIAANDIVTTVTNTIITTNDIVTTITNTVAVPDDKKATTELLASMDSIIGLDFKNELPTVITKTLISTAIKATATHFAWEATRQKRQDGTLDNGGIAGALILISASVYQAANNIADERTWTTLPKQFQFCRFPTPPDRKIELDTPDGIQKIPLTVGDGTINIIYVKSISPGAPLLVTQMKLK